MSDNRMVDNEEQRDDRKRAPLPANNSGRPNRRTRRMIAKRKGVFKHKGLWPYTNRRSSNEHAEQD